MALYLKTTNNTNITFPYSLSQLKEDNKNVSFPSDIMDGNNNDILVHYNVYPVTIAQEPTITDTQYLTQNTTPKLIEEEWTLDWTINDFSEEQLRQSKYNPTNFRLELMALESFKNWISSLSSNEYTNLVAIASQNNWSQLQTYFDELKNDFPLSQEIAIEWQNIADNNGINIVF